MTRLGLIGYPLDHSLSPVIQEAALKSCQLDGSYSLFPISPNDKQGLKDLLAYVRNGEIKGLNVTIPHKQNVIELLDELTPTAEIIGAVNTIYLRDHKLIGENTDAPGFLSDLKRFLATETRRDGDLNSLVLGAGGSARAVVYALLNDGWNVTVVARRMEQAHQLANSFRKYKLPMTTLSLADLEIDLPGLPSPVSLVVNTTPLGMMPNIDQSPWPEDLPFPARAAIYDLVYNPRETRLVREARLQGKAATTGLGMLIEQAALAFEIWTGCKPPGQTLVDAVHSIAH